MAAKHNLDNNDHDKCKRFAEFTAILDWSFFPNKIY